AAKHLGLLRREDVSIRLADDVLAGEMEGPFELLIDVEIATLQILEEDQARAVIQNGSKLCLPFAQVVFSLLLRADVQQCRSPANHTPLVIVHRKTLKMGPALNAGPIQKMSLTGLSRISLQHVLAVPMKGICTVRCNELPQWTTHHIFPTHAKQRAG